MDAILHSSRDFQQSVTARFLQLCALKIMVLIQMLSRDSEHTVGAYRSKQVMDAFVMEDWEILAMTRDG